MIFFYQKSDFNVKGGYSKLNFKLYLFQFFGFYKYFKIARIEFLNYNNMEIFQYIIVNLKN